MSSKYKLRRDGTWLKHGRPMVGAVFYGVGWEVRTIDGRLRLKVATRSSTRGGALKAINRLINKPEYGVIAVRDGHGSADGCFHPQYILGVDCWHFEVVSFAPAAKVMVSYE